MTLTESQKKGVFATAAFHTTVLLLFIFFGFITPYPPLPEGGILLDFGNSETGIGLEEPSAVQGVEIKNAKIKTSTVTKIVSAAPVKSKTQVKEQEDLLTQDYEQSVALNSAVKKKAADLKKKADEDKILKEKADKQKKAEEIEQQQLADAERIKNEEAAKKIGIIDSRTKKAFGGGKNDNGSQSQGQGVTYGPGNQGSPDGTPGANQYGLGNGSGNGTGDGISFDLKDRSALSLPKPKFPDGNISGIVVVEVTVNKFGKVTEALPGIKGSNTLESGLLEAAKKAALSASFKSEANAPAFQKGTITYHFVLQ